jgi:hypothetical protein
MSRANRGPIVVGVDIGGTRTAVLDVALPDVDVVFREVFPTQAAHSAARLRGELLTAASDALTCRTGVTFIGPPALKSEPTPHATPRYCVPASDRMPQQPAPR